MDNYKIVRYSSLNYAEWNEFVSKAKNATFLFHRDFMDYHKDRFEDFSLLVYTKNKLVGVLPANIVDYEVYSHQWLSYGGFVLPNKSSFQMSVGCVYSILKFLLEQKINTLFLKQTPKIYQLRPSDELDYLLFILNGKSYRKDVSMTIPLYNKLEFSTLRKRQLKIANQNDLQVRQESNLTSFWNNILIPNLRTKHDTQPTHTLNEIAMLREKFPNNIKQYNVYYKDELLAGCTVFETKTVAHLQYISTKKDKNIGALDYLIEQLITKIYKNKNYLDFGISNENEGKNINEGLLNWKQSFGASAIIHDFYKVQVENYPALNKIMI